MRSSIATAAWIFWHRFDWRATFLELSTMSIGFVAQTNTDVHVMRTFVNGTAIRRVEYNREGGGWGILDGEPQPWERAYFFDEERSAGGNNWPDMLDDEISDEDRARYEEAKRAGDPSAIIGLLHPYSLAPMWRVCEAFGIRRRRPTRRDLEEAFGVVAPAAQSERVDA